MSQSLSQWNREIVSAKFRIYPGTWWKDKITLLQTSVFEIASRDWSHEEISTRHQTGMAVSSGDLVARTSLGVS